ncbi:2Fe-2S iron-sulfur cluster binding domain-containing protein [Nocardioides sp. MAH-18]|uniref:2Fe-2S iron-sulfur cluster binding domain-containing protein n=1 Tax=Nocardioides agri TaxID=2682843 RepID=A0A6L6XZI8_9ACTN|nr:MULTISPECIES: ferredoxin--NADP reductase [unclassified Nocardioides]MBA2952895.1 ferredoxin--NADP reductase [Nocardioides sp. CGMCC 1.13656]MVQ52057.1 2Fe-2S iron-sulfur cluster binding domain-containing protein [Nocardioides sp. MAH-18]
MPEDSFEVKVVDVVEETADAHSISFEVPAGAEEQFAYKPGQFLTLAVPSDRTGVAARCYSLSSSPVGDGPLTITVKRTVDGYASNWVCDNLRTGDSIRVLPPSGIFTPASLDADLLLLAAGSGVTPIMSITRTALEQGSGRIVVFYANRDERSVIFAGELTRLAAAHPDRLSVVHWLESVQGLPSQEQLAAFASRYASYDAFVCGPAPFMKLAIGALKELGFPRERRHQEKFISLGGNPFGDLHDKEVAEHEIEDAERDLEDVPDPVEPGPEGPVRLEVELDGQQYEFDDWAPGTKMLEHLESKGVKAPYSCREGECSACAVRLLEGEVKMLHNDVLDDDDLAEGIRLGCQSLPVTDTVKVTYH